MKKIVSLSILILILTSSIVMAEKFKIGIGEIEYKAELSESDKNRAAYGNGTENTKAFVDMLTTAIAKTRKFDIIERNRMAEILKEQAMGDSGLISEDSAQKIGTLEGVDFIVLGSITEYGIEQKGASGAGFGFQKSKAIMTVDIRIVDASTGSIIIAETVTKDKQASKGVKVVGFGTSDKNGKVLSEVMRECANGVSSLIISTVYPVKIISIASDGVIMLNYGNGYLAQGNVLEVYSQGEKIVDPDTGEILGCEEKKLGRIIVSNCQAKFSKANAVNSEESKTMNKGMICRMVCKKQLEKEKEANIKEEKQKKKKRLF